MKPQTLVKVGFATLCCCSELQAAPALSCPPMPAAVTEVNRDVRSDVGLSVGALGKLKAGELSIKTETLAKNLFSQYPDVNRLLTLQMMSSTYCSMLNSIDVPIQDKLDRWERFQDKVLFIQAEVTPPKVQDGKATPAAKPQPTERAPSVESSALPAAPKIEKPFYVKLATTTCERTANGLTIFRFKGSAKIPVGAVLSAGPAVSQGWKQLSMECSSWSKTTTNTCKRETGEAAEGTWSGTYTLDWPSGPYKDPTTGKVSFSAQAWFPTEKLGALATEVANTRRQLSCS